MSRPDLTVALATADDPDLLDRALARLAAQRVGMATAWELLVVDDGERTTAAVLAAWSRRAAFPVLRTVRPERPGLGQGRRAAVAAAASGLVAFVDGDCLVEPKWVEAAVAFAREKPRAGAFGGRVRLRWEGEPSRLARECEWALAPQDRGELAVKLAERGCEHLVGAGLVVRREALESSGWMERGASMDVGASELAAGADAELSLLVRASAWEVWYTPTLRMERILPASRGEYAHLARLHGESGRALPYTWILGGVREPTRWTAISIAVASLVAAGRKALSALVHRARGEPLYVQRRMLQARRSVGCFRGALELARHEEPAATPAGPDLQGASGAVLPQP